MKEQINAFLKNCREGNLEAVRATLTENAAFALATDEYGNTALHYACDPHISVYDKNLRPECRLCNAASGKVEIIKILLDMDVDIDAQNVDGNTALHVLLRNFSPDSERVVLILNALLDRKPNVDIKNNEGRAAFSYGLGSKRSEVIRNAILSRYTLSGNPVREEDSDSDSEPEPEPEPEPDNIVQNGNAKEDASQLQRFLSFVSSHKIEIMLCVAAIAVCLYHRTAILSIGSGVLNSMLNLDKEAISRVM